MARKLLIQNTAIITENHRLDFFDRLSSFVQFGKSEKGRDLMSLPFRSAILTAMLKIQRLPFALI
jgi:hypothetical protein